MTNITDEDGKQLAFGIAVGLVAGLLLVYVNYALAASNTVEYRNVEKEIEEIQREREVRLVVIPDEVEEEPEPVVVDSDTFLYYASYCESRHRQFDTDGSVLLGRVDPRDTGRWQINTYYWGDKALELGYDIYTEQGNYAMARYILEHAQGEQAWSASAPCIAANFGYIIK